MQEPLLQFKNPDGTVKAEYIPVEHSKLGDRVRDAREWLARRLGWDTYWWHLDHMYPPEMRKRYDLHFLRHVDEAHDGVPDDPKERRNYLAIKSMYSHEYEWAKRQQSIENEYNAIDREALGNDAYIDADKIPHIYATAYLLRWWNVETLPNWNLLYHGVHTDDGMQIIIDDWDAKGMRRKSD